MTAVKSAIFSAALLLIFCGSLRLAGAADAADPATPSGIVLSPQARALFERGAAAAKKSPPDWRLAIDSFSQAEEAQPLAGAFPPLLLNFGLAHAGAGHEMAALYWLQAYLVAAPGAPNAAAVRDLIARQRAALETKIGAILDSARRVVQQFPPGPAREWAAGYVENVYARFEALIRRDIATAIRRRPADESYLWQEYGRMLAALGDITGALAVVEKIPNKAAIRPWAASAAAPGYVYAPPTYALPTYTGRRDDVRLAILDALDSGDADDARFRAILKAFDNSDLALQWQVQHALRQNRAAEATALAGNITSTDIRDELLQNIVDHYLDVDWKNRSRFSLARDAVAKISTPQGRARATVSLIYMALSIDDAAAARAVAQAARDASPQANLPFLIDIVLDKQAVLALHVHSQGYLIVSLVHHALRGEFEEARRVGEAARRDLKGEELTKFADVESRVFAHALAARISGLLSQRKLEAARSAAARFPRAACDGDVSRSLTRDRLIALRNHIAALQRIADEEIAGGRLDAAAATVRSMPIPSGEPGLVSPCVVEKADEMAALARAYLAGGRADRAKAVVAEIRSLLWRGALDKLLLPRLAQLQEDLGDATGAAATRRMEMFVPLTYWIWGARTFSSIPVVLDLPGALQKVGAGAANASERPDMDMTRGIADTAARLSAWLQDYDVSIRRPGGRDPWTSVR